VSPTFDTSPNSLKLVRRYGLIAVERLNVKGMLGSRRLARSISDAGWSAFVSTLKHKAESAGVEVVEVDPKGTSQQCSAAASWCPKSCGCGRTAACNADWFCIEMRTPPRISLRALQARTELVGYGCVACLKKPSALAGGVVTDRGEGDFSQNGSLSFQKSRSRIGALHGLPFLSESEFSVEQSKGKCEERNGLVLEIKGLII